MPQFSGIWDIQHGLSFGEKVQRIRGGDGDGDGGWCNKIRYTGLAQGLNFG